MTATPAQARMEEHIAPDQGSHFRKVAMWMLQAGQTVRTRPTSPDEVTQEEIRLRIKLIAEEFKELQDAIDMGDVVAIADGIADLEYVVLGTAATFGIDADAVFDIVHDNNWTKFGSQGQVLRRPDGKIQKWPNWAPPTADIAALIFAAQQETGAQDEG